MSTEASVPIAEGVTSVDQKPMSDSDFLSRRIAKLSGTPEPQATEPKEPESEPEATPAADATKESAEATPEKPKDVLSKDLEEMTADELNDLAKKLGSKAVARYGELTYKRKQAEEQLNALRAELARRDQQQATLAPKVENNPYGNIASVDELRTKKQQVDEMIEWAEDVLFEADKIGHDEIAADVDGKQYTKADIRRTLQNARKARDKYIPAQLNELNARTMRQAQEEQFRQVARKELPWLETEDNDVRKKYEAVLNDPVFKKIKTAVPEIAPQIEYIFAHATNSIFGRRNVVEAEPKKPGTLNPPSSPRASAAAPERSDARAAKSVQEVEARFRETGSPDDFIALRTAQLSKRR
jgi:hypothetical protein